MDQKMGRSSDCSGRNITSSSHSVDFCFWRVQNFHEGISSNGTSPGANLQRELRATGRTVDAAIDSTGSRQIRAREIRHLAWARIQR
jgi:hypothetical protein